MIQDRLSALEKENFLIRLVALFKKFKAEKLNEHLWRYRVANTKFHIYPSDYLYTVWMLTGEELTRISCTNENNVYGKLETLLKRLKTDKS